MNCFFWFFLQALLYFSQSFVTTSRGSTNKIESPENIFNDMDLMARQAESYRIRHNLVYNDYEANRLYALAKSIEEEKIAAGQSFREYWRAKYPELREMERMHSLYLKQREESANLIDASTDNDMHDEHAGELREAVSAMLKNDLHAAQLNDQAELLKKRHLKAIADLNDYLHKKNQTGVNK